MGTTYTPNPTTTGFHNNTKINTNLEAIRVALERALSRHRDGVNQMESDLDMNSQRLLNLPAPTSVREPVTIEYLNTLTSPPAIANVGNPMPVDLDFNNTFTAVNVIDPINPQDVVTLNYFEANHSGSSAVALLDADTLDTHDSAADPLVPVSGEIPYWDANGDIGVRRLHLTDAVSTADATHVAVANASNGEVRFVTFPALKAQLGGTALEFTVTSAFPLTSFVGASVVVAHAHGGYPAQINIQYQCAVAEFGFPQGAVVAVSPQGKDADEATGPNTDGWGIHSTDTDITAFHNGNPLLHRTDTGGLVAVTPANWLVKFVLTGTVAGI